MGSSQADGIVSQGGLSPKRLMSKWCATQSRANPSPAVIPVIPCSGPMLPQEQAVAVPVRRHGTINAFCFMRLDKALLSNNNRAENFLNRSISGK